jgi:hypothetical protein
MHTNSHSAAAPATWRTKHDRMTGWTRMNKKFSRWNSESFGLLPTHLSIASCSSCHPVILSIPRKHLPYATRRRDELRALLGTERLGLYIDYERTRLRREWVAELQRRLGADDLSTFQQEERSRCWSARIGTPKGDRQRCSRAMDRCHRRWPLPASGACASPRKFSARRSGRCSSAGSLHTPTLAVGVAVEILIPPRPGHPEWTQRVAKWK